MKKVLALATLCIACLQLPTSLMAKQFSDVSNAHPNFVAVNYLSDSGVINGYSDGTFQPAKLVNRAEALKIIFAGLNQKIEKTEGEVAFKDIKAEDWFKDVVSLAKSKGIVSGNADGNFAPARNVTRAEFLKMLLNTAGFKAEPWAGKESFADVPKDAWFNPFMNYAGQAGLVEATADKKLLPDQNLTRGEVVEIIYLMKIILNGKNTQFLVAQSESQMAQIELFIANSDIKNAKRASELSVDLTQQAYRNLPDNNVVLGAAKIAKGYDALVDAFIFALKKDFVKAKEMSNLVIAKADEAWQANNETQPIARHLKDRAREILAQIEKTAPAN